jgi:hypothetical protein
VELSEFQNFAIQNAIIEADYDEEERKDTLLGSASRPTHKDRMPDRISCTYREIARNCRNELGITFGQTYNLNQTSSNLKNSAADDSSDNESDSNSAGGGIKRQNS